MIPNARSALPSLRKRPSAAMWCGAGAVIRAQPAAKIPPPVSTVTAVNDSSRITARSDC